MSLPKIKEMECDLTFEKNWNKVDVPAIDVKWHQSRTSYAPVTHMLQPFGIKGENKREIFKVRFLSKDKFSTLHKQRVIVIKLRNV